MGYNPEIHDIYRGLAVRPVRAGLLTEISYKDEGCEFHASQTILVQPKDTKYRGDVLLCVTEGGGSGYACGLVELYGTKPVKDFTEDDWQEACVGSKRPKKGYGWLLRNPRKVIEVPVWGTQNKGLFEALVAKDDITIYPRMVVLGEDGERMVKDAARGKLKMKKNGNE